MYDVRLSGDATAEPSCIFGAVQQGGVANSCAPICNFTVPNGTYTDNLIKCAVSPGIGGSFEIQIRGKWLPVLGLAFRGPVVTSVSPHSFPITGGPLTVFGSNFGASMQCGGTVTVNVTVPPSQHLTFDPTFVNDASLPVGFPPLAFTSVPCGVTAWSGTQVSCIVPVGLNVSAAVTLTVGGQSSTVANAINFASPTITAVVNGDGLPSIGGTAFTIIGTSLPVPGLGYDVAVMAGRSLCTCFPDNMTSTSLTCLSPPGTGTVPIVVFTPEQHSVSDAVLTYLPPVVSAVAPAAASAMRSVDGGFIVTVAGANFLPGSSNVTIASSTACSNGAALPCTNVVVEPSAYASLTCVAPPGCGDGVLTVTVQHSGHAPVTIPFQYDPPVVTAAYNQTTDATLTSPVLVVGSNFGAPGHVLPSISIGAMLCIDVRRANSSTLTCSMPPTVVGRYDVVVLFGGVSSGTGVVVDRMCGAGLYGSVGQSCQVCPAVRGTLAP